ncbi:MAG: TRAP transporter large permease [Planctomycetaceae bacterium]|nr:TRAP transporter large permease [Planctomycetaceae bacterium]
MGIALVAAFFVLFILGFPVIYAILLPSAAYIYIEGLPLGLLAQRITYALDSFPLVAVPIFIFAGNLMNLAGVAERIFHFANVLVGRVPGGLAQVNIFSSLIFSGMSGAALADVGGLGRIEIEAMKKRGFDVPFSAAVTVSSAIVGPIFPPSIPLIVYGSVATVSIIQLLIAGIVPAIICVIFLMVTTYFIAQKRQYPRSARWPTFAEVMFALWPALPAILAPVLMVGGMMAGWFTPTEAASVTVLYILAISHFYYRELTWTHLKNATITTIRSTGAILMICASAALYGWILAVEQIPQQFASLVLGGTTDPIVLLIIVNVIFFIVGMFLDSTTATLLVVPIIAPPLVAAGIDPVHLGILTIFNIMIGIITPPMGLALFLISDIANVTMKQLLKALLPYYFPLLATLAVITFCPDLILWLPGLMR